MALKRGTLGRDATKVLQRFVALASEIPDVQLVLLANDTDEGPRIWTVIDEPRLQDTVRYQVYAAEGKALGGMAEPPLGFRVINLRELKHPLREVLPRAERVLLDRRPAG